MKNFEEYNYDGKFNKEISNYIGYEFNEYANDYKLVGYIWDYAFGEGGEINSAIVPNIPVVVPSGELQPYCKVCFDYLNLSAKDEWRIFNKVIEKYKDNQAMICMIAEIYEEYRYDAEDVPFSKICGNIPDNVGIKVFNVPMEINVEKVGDDNGYYSYVVNSIWNKRVGKNEDARVFVKDIFKEYLLCSAEKYENLNGLIILGARHHNCLQYMGISGLREYGVFENDNTVIGGFYTNTGRFIRRDDEVELSKILRNHINVERTSGINYYSEDFLYTFIKTMERK